MATQHPTMITIPIDNFIYRVAWYELRGKKCEADALRLMAADAQPVYRVDENAVNTLVAYFRGFDEKLLPLD